jgi:hypothetical protein
MDLKRDNALTEDLVGLLRAQLTETLCLAAHVQRAEVRIRGSRRHAGELLSGISRELWSISEVINRRVSAWGEEKSPSNPVTKSFPSDDDRSLDVLLNRFCLYVRNTSDRRSMASAQNDRETVFLLDRILSVANRGIWFLDIYSNAMWLNCRLSLLPKWTPAPASRHIAS